MAFDKLSHVGLISALTRFGLPQKYVDLIQDVYTDPTFEVKELNTRSATYPQGSGVRQGCPLSPYLFVMFLTVLMTDVKNELARRFPEIGIQNPYHVFSSNTPLLELTYADDIILFSKSTTVLQEVFTTLQQHAARYCMQLNLDKTCIMHMNTPVPFPRYYFTPLAP